MSNYNILNVELDCPRCGTRVTVESEVKLGYLDVLHYQVGDPVEWFEGGGGDAARPPEGRLDGEAYAECPECQKDFWLTVHVRNDRFESAEIDHTRKGNVP